MPRRVNRTSAQTLHSGRIIDTAIRTCAGRRALVCNATPRRCWPVAPLYLREDWRFAGYLTCSRCFHDAKIDANAVANPDRNRSIDAHLAATRVRGAMRGSHTAKRRQGHLRREFSLQDFLVAAFAGRLVVRIAFPSQRAPSSIHFSRSLRLTRKTLPKRNSGKFPVSGSIDRRSCSGISDSRRHMECHRDLADTVV